MTTVILSPGGEELRLATQMATDGRARLILAVPGMNCGGCVATIEGVVRAIPGVVDARANLTRKSLTVRWRCTQVDEATILAALVGAGFDAFPLDAGEGGRAGRGRAARSGDAHGGGRIRERECHAALRLGLGGGPMMRPATCCTGFPP